MQNFNIQASLSSCADWFEFYMVGNPDDKFSRVMAHM